MRSTAPSRLPWSVDGTQTTQHFCCACKSFQYFMTYCLLRVCGEQPPSYYYSILRYLSYSLHTQVEARWNTNTTNKYGSFARPRLHDRQPEYVKACVQNTTVANLPRGVLIQHMSLIDLADFTEAQQKPNSWTSTDRHTHGFLKGTCMPAQKVYIKP